LRFGLIASVNEITNANGNESVAGKLVDAKGLLNALFDESCRPSLRWIRDQQRRRVIPFVRIGRLVFFDVSQVRARLFPSTPANTRMR
jgi:hypothetical protein